MSRDGIKSVTTPSELIESHQHNQTKTHTVFDGNDRPRFVFTASVDAINGAPCLVTEYVYRDSSSFDIIGQQERVYSWNSSWETNYTFDPNTSYDPDGNGVI